MGDGEGDIIHYDLLNPKLNNSLFDIKEWNHGTTAIVAVKRFSTTIKRSLSLEYTSTALSDVTFVLGDPPGKGYSK